MPSCSTSSISRQHSEEETRSLRTSESKPIYLKSKSPWLSKSLMKILKLLLWNVFLPEVFFFFANLGMEFKRESAPPQAFTPKPMTGRVHQWRVWGSIKLGQLLQCNSSLPICPAFAAKDFGSKGKELFWNTVRSYVLLQTSFKITYSHLFASSGWQRYS